MKNTSNSTHTLTKIDEHGYAQTIEFTPLADGRVRIYWSEMGDDNIRTTEDAREAYRAAKAKGWS